MGGCFFFPSPSVRQFADFTVMIPPTHFTLALTPRVAIAGGMVEGVDGPIHFMGNIIGVPCQSSRFNRASV